MLLLLLGPRLMYVHVHSGTSPSPPPRYQRLSDLLTSPSTNFSRSRRCHIRLSISTINTDRFHKVSSPNIIQSRQKERRASEWPSTLLGIIHSNLRVKKDNAVIESTSPEMPCQALCENSSRESFLIQAANAMQRNHIRSIIHLPSRFPIPLCGIGYRFIRNSCTFVKVYPGLL